MKKWLLALGMAVVGLLIAGCSLQANSDKSTTISSAAVKTTSVTKKNRLQITDNYHHKVIFKLNNSKATKSLKKQLPLKVKVRNYSSNEKIFYPNKLKTRNTPLSQGKKGDLAYFAPWGDVVMYYGDAGPYDGLYQLGKCISGKNQIAKLKGKITLKLIK